MRTKRGETSSADYKRVMYALLASNGVTLLLFLSRSVESQTDRYWFLLWNLFLAWLPLLFAWLFVRQSQRSRVFGWQSLMFVLLWLGFLPNSFYLISDLTHLQVTGEVSLVYDAVMFMSFICNGLIAGFMSMFLVHQELHKRIGGLWSYAVMTGVLLLSSFAIYLGRSLDWNTWDVLINPAGLLFDVSDRVANPSLHAQSFVTTATFFLLLSSMYAVVWELALLLKNSKR